MEHAGISNATARAKMAGSRQFGQMRAPVQFLTIDEMLAAIGEPDGRRVSLLKLDVEGYEFAEGLLEQVVAQSAHSVSTTPRGLDPAPAVHGPPRLDDIGVADVALSAAWVLQGSVMSIWGFIPGTTHR